MSSQSIDKGIITIIVAIVVQAGGIVWWASNLAARVSHNDYQIQMMRPVLEEAISFTKLWPAGKWGSGELPSDTRQDLKTAALERQVEKLTSKLYNGNK